MPSYKKLVPRVLPGIPHAWCREKKEKKKKYVKLEIKIFLEPFFFFFKIINQKECALSTQHGKNKLNVEFTYKVEGSKETTCPKTARSMYYSTALQDYMYI